jgi:hypothetical protein
MLRVSIVVLLCYAIPFSPESPCMTLIAFGRILELRNFYGGL